MRAAHLRSSPHPQGGENLGGFIYFSALSLTLEFGFPIAWGIENAHKKLGRTAGIAEGNRSDVAKLCRAMLAAAAVVFASPAEAQPVGCSADPPYGWLGDGCFSTTQAITSNPNPGTISASAAAAMDAAAAAAFAAEMKKSQNAVAAENAAVAAAAAAGAQA